MTTELLCDKKFLQFGIKERLSQAKLLTEHFLYIRFPVLAPASFLASTSAFLRMTSIHKTTSVKPSDTCQWVEQFQMNCYSVYAALRQIRQSSFLSLQISFCIQKLHTATSNFMTKIEFQVPKSNHTKWHNHQEFL